METTKLTEIAWVKDSDWIKSFGLRTHENIQSNTHEMCVTLLYDNTAVPFKQVFAGRDYRIRLSLLRYCAHIHTIEGCVF